MRFLIINFMVQVSLFGTVLEHFTQRNFEIFRRWIFTQVTRFLPLLD